MKSALASLLLAAASAIACDTSTGGPSGAAAARTVPVESTPPLLERMRRAADTVPHTGVRHYEAHVDHEGVDVVLAYTERVQDRGNGCFSIEPLEVQGSAVDDPFLFLGLQRERQAFFRRYRDFRIRDLDLFLRNYEVRDSGVETIVAGRPATVLTAESRADGHRYTLSIDDETALVLAYREELSDGRLASSMRYESFEPAAGPTFRCFESDVSEEPLRLREDFDHQLGFDVWSPALAPDGYEPFAASRVRDPRGFDWFKLTFTDGVETLFFLQREPDGSAEVRDPALAGAPAGAHDDRVLVYETGSLSIVQGSLDSREVMAVGKVASRALLALLDSARG